MSAIRISLRSVLLVVAVAAVGLAGFGASSKIWSAALHNLNIAALIACAVAAIYARDGVRAFSVGFLIGNGFITLLEFVPSFGRPLVHAMLAWRLWHPDSPESLTSADVQRAVIGTLLTGWVYGCLAGLLAVSLRRKHCRQTGDQERVWTDEV